MDINQLIKEKPVIRDMADCKEIFWINPRSDQPAKLPFTMADIYRGRFSGNLQIRRHH